MPYFMPDDILARALADLQTMPERIGASADVALGYAHALITLRYTLENDHDASRRLGLGNSFEQTEAVTSELVDGPLGRVALRVLLRHGEELAATVIVSLDHELSTTERSDPRAVGEATMAAISHWVHHTWPWLAADIAAELDDGARSG